MRTRTFVFIVLISSLLFSGCESIIENILDLNKDDNFKEIGTGVISSDHRFLTIEDESSFFNGLEISVTDNFSASSVSFIVESGDIPEKTFSEYFNPIGEMLRISNGGEYSGNTFFIKIPITTTKDEIPLAFAYNETSGSLEPLPIVFYDDSQLIFAASHFTQRILDSDLKSGGSEVQKDYANILISAFSLTSFEIQDIFMSDFVPGVDDWEFSNGGSVVEKEGNCAGHSLSALFYYDYKIWANQIGLTHLYDRDHDPKLWQDNTLGIRLVSEIQNKCDTVASIGIWNDFLKAQPYAAASDFFDNYHKSAFMTTAAQLLISQKPIYTIISPKNNLQDLHAVLIIGINMADSILYIADPNFPGQTRTTKLKSDGYYDYISGPNARANNNIFYERFVCLGFSQMHDWGIVADYWRELIDGTIGDQRFPDCEYSRTINPGEKDENVNIFAGVSKTWLGDLSVSSNDKIMRLSCNVVPKGSSQTNSGMWIWNNNSFIVKSEPGKNYVDLDLEAFSLHNSTIGIYVFEEYNDPNGVLCQSWADFKWLNISEFTLEPKNMEGEKDTEYSWTVSIANPPTNIRFEWTFGDDTGRDVIKNSNTVTHTYKEDGRYPIFVLGYNDDTDEIIGVAAGMAIIQESKSLEVNEVSVTLANIEGKPFFTYSDDSWDTEWSIGLGSGEFKLIESSITDGNMKIITERRSDNGNGVALTTQTIVGQFSIGDRELYFTSLNVKETRSWSDGHGRSSLVTKDIEIVNFTLDEIYVPYSDDPTGYEMENAVAEEVKPMIKSISHQISQTDSEGNTTEKHLTGVKWENAKPQYFNLRIVLGSAI